MVTRRTPLVMAHTTLEYVHIPIPGSNTLTTPPEIAFTVTADEPEEDDDGWHQAAWVQGNARLLIGPGEGATQLLTGQYRIWIRFTAGAERPVRNAGLLFIT